MMNHEIPGARAPYRPIDPAAARRESEPSPWPTRAGARRELVCRAARQHEPTSEECDEARGSAVMVARVVAVLALLAVVSFCAAAAWAIASVWR